MKDDVLPHALGQLHELLKESAIERDYFVKDLHRHFRRICDNLLYFSLQVWSQLQMILASNEPSLVFICFFSDLLLLNLQGLHVLLNKLLVLCFFSFHIPFFVSLPLR